MLLKLQFLYTVPGNLNICFGLLVGLSFLLVLVCINCTSDDDNDNNISDNDDSDSSSCSQIINPESNKTNALAMNFSSTDITDCLPELPDPIYETQLTILLEGYLGQYHSEVGTIRTISCRPDGEWVIPNYDAVDLWCGWSYEIPVWIELEEVTGKYSGYISHNIVSPSADSIETAFNQSGLLNIYLEDYDYSAFIEIDERVVWKFHYYPNSPPSPPEDEREGFITWTKDEPFEE
jgi:hypothetical protein